MGPHADGSPLRGDAAYRFAQEIVLGIGGLKMLQALKKMAKNPIVFALANSPPEIMPEEAEPYARIIATDRSGYLNQINNVLAFPGIFRGALDARATDINEAIKLAAAKAIASCIPEDELSEEYIVPSVFNKQVMRRVARAVEAAAHKSGAAMRSHHAHTSNREVLSETKFKVSKT